MAYPKKGLSIDIGNDKVKIIQYQRKGSKIKIVKSLLLDTPDNCLNDGVLVNLEAISGIIREELNNQSIKEKKVIFTVASSKIITREVDLPDLPKKKLDALIQMNAEEYFPVDLSEYITDYRVLDHYVDGDDKLIRVNMVAAYTEMMESYINLAGVLGLKVVGLDFAGNSIVNYANHLKKDGTYLLLDLGSSSTMVTIMGDGVVRFNRNLAYGSAVVINSIQNHFNVRYKEAVKIAGEQQLLKDDSTVDDLLSKEVIGSMDQILSGVSRLVDFYTSRNKDGIEKIYLVGGGTRFQGIDDHIANHFNIEADVVGPIDCVISDDVNYIENSVFYSNAIGAVYSEVNLLPEEFMNRDKDKASNRLRLELAILALLLLAGALYSPFMSIRALESEKITIQDEIDEKKIIVSIKEEYESALARMMFYDNVTQGSASTTEVMLAIMESMEVAIPSEVDYLNISNSEDGMLISCVTNDKLVIVKFIEVLKSMKIDDEIVFSNVYVPAFTNPEADVRNLISDEEVFYTFFIACDYAKGVE